MSDTYQAKIAHTGRSHGMVTLTVERVAGDDCPEWRLVYINSYHWHPDRVNHIMHLDFDASILPAFSFPTCVCVHSMDIEIV